MAGGAAGAKCVNLCSFVSNTHLPLTESERPREQLGLRLGQLVTPRVGRAGQALVGGGRGRTCGPDGRGAWVGDSEPQLSVLHRCGVTPLVRP